MKGPILSIQDAHVAHGLSKTRMGSLPYLLATPYDSLRLAIEEAGERWGIEKGGVDIGVVGILIVY